MAADDISPENEAVSGPATERAWLSDEASLRAAEEHTSYSKILGDCAHDLGRYRRHLGVHRPDAQSSAAVTGERSELAAKTPQP